MIEVVPEYDDWISCNEQMPEVGQKVFVRSETVGLHTWETIGHYDGESWICPMIPEVHIIAWRPTIGGKSGERQVYTQNVCRECREQKRNVYINDAGEWQNACETCQYREVS